MPEVYQKAGALVVWNLASGTRRLMVPLGTIPGVILNAPGESALLGAGDRNGPGKGAIRSEGDGTRIAWRSPGSATFGPAVDVGSDGDYLLEDGEDPGKYVQARVKAAYLSPKPIERAVYLQHRWNNDWLDVNAANAAAGLIQTQQFQVANLGGSTISNLRVWIDPAAPYLSVAVDDPPTVYSTPTTEEASLRIERGLDAPGVLRGDWSQEGNFSVKRTIPAATVSDAKVLSLLHFVFDGI